MHILLNQRLTVKSCASLSFILTNDIQVCASCFCCVVYFGGAFMGFSFWIRLYSECFRLAGGFGLRACFRFMTGRLQLDDSVLKSCGLAVGGSDA